MTIKHISVLAGAALLSLFSVNAGMKQMEIKGKISLNGYTVSYDNGTNALRGGSDSIALLETDLDFKMKFSKDVSARIDLEMDGAKAGDTTFVGQAPSSARNSVANRFDIGIDQAFFKLNDFLFKNLSLSIGKQNLNFSLRDNKSFSWAWGDPIALLGSYSTRDVDIRAYWAKYEDSSDLSQASGASTNDADRDVYGTYIEYWLNDDSLIIGYLNYLSDDGHASLDNIFHYGIGIDYFIGEALELYAELAGQSVSSSNAAFDGSAFQVTAGVQYAFTDFDLKPEINVEFYLQSGAETNDPAWQNIGGGARGAENQSIFVEGTGADAAVNDYNFGAGIAPRWGAGYSAIRLNGWISPTKSTKVGLGVHIFKDEDDGVTNDDMGIEIDLTGAWKYSSDVTFRAGAFIWTGAETDGTTPVATGDYEDVTGLMIGSNLSF